MLRNFLAVIALILLSLTAVIAQDEQELKAERAASSKLKGEHPLMALAKSKPSTLRKELEGVHPRVFMTQGDIDALKAKAKSQPHAWKIAVSRVRALTVEPPAPPAEARRVQNEVGLGIAEAAFAYKITGEKKYLDAARKYMDAAVSYDVWGYSYNKPNVDLAAGHLLYGMGWAYDLLYHDLSDSERAKYRNKLVKQGNLLYEFFKPKSGKTYAYSQNHTSIPIAGLAIAAYALMGEVPEAKEWAGLSRAVYDRVLATYGEDGYFYESMEYWIFSAPWIIHYIDAHKHATGENLYTSTPGLAKTHIYLAHITLPGGEFNFDFGDIYAGPVTRARKGDDYARERIDGRFRTNYAILYNLARQYSSADSQGVADWLKSKGQVNAEEIWAFIWHDPAMKATPIEKQSTRHYFEDHGIVFWRSSWADDATAFAFKAGPPEGHAATAKTAAFPDWRLSSGHAHPDAGSFIIWANGEYLTGDSGYAGVPLTEHHNTVTFDGLGQNREGKGHDVFVGIPYEQLNKIKVTKVEANDKRVRIEADLAAAYEPEVGVRSFIRTFEFSAPGDFTVSDSIHLSQPRKITSYFHADTRIDKYGDRSFFFEPEAPALRLDVVSPADPEAKTEPNFLTAPGRPGSVDKGEREQRGYRLALSTPAKADKVRMSVKMTIVRK